MAADENVVYSEQELARIAQELQGTAVQPDEVFGLTFDFTDEELQRFYKIMLSINERYARRNMDLRTQMDMKNLIVDECFSAGFIVNVGWEYKQNPLTGFTIVSPDVTVTDRVGGLTLGTDHERKYYDSSKRPKIEDVVPNKKVIEKLID